MGTLYIRGADAIPSIASQRWSDFDDNIVTLSIDDVFPWIGFEHTLDFPVLPKAFAKDNKSSHVEMDLTIYWQENKWATQREFWEYCDAFTRCSIGKTPFSCSFSFEVSSLDIHIGVSSHNEGLAPRYEETLGLFIERVDLAVRATHEEALASLAVNTPSAVALRFAFPESVRVPCEQYLIYFAEFLKDAGMNAATDLKHEAGSVLFTVTPDGDMTAPDDVEEALDNIRKALGIYLSLPANPAIVQAPVYNHPPELMMLAATVKHLDSQLDYANAKAQAQATTIQNQQMLIGTLSNALQTVPQPITAAVFVESVRAVVEKNKDAEVFLGGTVELTKYEGQGFNLNLAAAFRHVSGLFAKQKAVAKSGQVEQIKALQLPEKRKGGE